MIKIKHFSLSIKGRRKYNQDSFIIKKYTPDIYFFAIADGMGSVFGGEQASQLAIKTADSYIKNICNVENTLIEPKQILQNIYNNINSAIKLSIEEEPRLRGMGTTFVSVLIWHGKWVAGNIGDSRLFTVKSDLKQITEDHTFLQDYMNKYGKKVEESIINKYGNVLLKVLNGVEDVPDLYPVDSDATQLKIGDEFLLCSDGLILDKTDSQNKTITKYMKKVYPLNWKVKQLVSKIYRSGSEDNITALSVKITGV